MHTPDEITTELRTQFPYLLNKDTVELTETYSQVELKIQLATTWPEKLTSLAGITNEYSTSEYDTLKHALKTFANTHNLTFKDGTPDDETFAYFELSPN